MTDPDIGSDKPPAAPSFRRQISSTGWALLVFAIVLVLFLVLTGWSDAVDAISTLGLVKLMILASLALSHYLIRALRWQIMVQTGGVALPWRTNALYFFGGFAMIATPGRLGELIRLRWLMRATGRGFGQVLPIVYADRAIELASILGVIVLALTLSSLGSMAVWWVLVAGLGVTWLACRPKGLLVVLKPIIAARKPELFRKVRRLTEEIDPFIRPWIFVPVLVIGMIGWSFEGVAFWLLLEWLNAEVTLASATAIFLIAVFSGALSGLPGGLGGAEATSVGLLLLQGVSLEAAVLATTIIRIATLWFAVAIGLCVLPFAEARTSGAG